MVRMSTPQGDFSLELQVESQNLKQHTIEGRHVVQACPNKAFTIALECHEEAPPGSVFLVEAFIDDKSLAGRYLLDPSGVTSRGGSKTLEFSSWRKSAGDGQVVKHGLTFTSTTTKGTGDDDDDEGGARPAGAASWTYGKVTVNVHAGVVGKISHDQYGMSHNPDMSRRAVVDEKTMVKNGLSLSAGQGAAQFSAQSMWRAGETHVARAPGDPIVATLEVFFRDSFFMCLREDECCGGACKPKRAEDGAAASASSSSSASTSSGAADLREAADDLARHEKFSGNASQRQTAREVRDKAVRERETQAALARKRPKEEGPIDLCDSD